MSSTASPNSRAANVGGRLRWYVCGLLFYATTVNYVDRQVLAILKPVISNELGWNEKQYGWVVFFFQLAYALMLPVAALSGTDSSHAASSDATSSSPTTRALSLSPPNRAVADSCFRS